MDKIQASGRGRFSTQLVFDTSRLGASGPCVLRIFLLRLNRASSERACKLPSHICQPVYHQDSTCVPRMQLSKDALPLRAGTKHNMRSAVSRWRVGCLHRTSVVIVFKETEEETINNSKHHCKSLLSIDTVRRRCRKDRRSNGSHGQHGSQEYGTSRSPSVNPQQCRPKCFSTRFKYSKHHSVIASKFFFVHTRSRPVSTKLSPVIPRNVMSRHCAFKSTYHATSCHVMFRHVTSRHVMSWVQPSPVEQSPVKTRQVKSSHMALYHDRCVALLHHVRCVHLLSLFTLSLTTKFTVFDSTKSLKL